MTTDRSDEQAMDDVTIVFSHDDTCRLQEFLMSRVSNFSRDVADWRRMEKIIDTISAARKKAEMDSAPIDTMPTPAAPAAQVERPSMVRIRELAGDRVADACQRGIDNAMAEIRAEEAADEKERRIYYQDIVYKVCNILDTIFKPGTCCGMSTSPTTEVQDRVTELVRDRTRLAAMEAIAELIPGLERGCDCGYDYRCGNCQRIVEIKERFAAYRTEHPTPAQERK